MVGDADVSVGGGVAIHLDDAVRRASPMRWYSSMVKSLRATSAI